MSLSALVEEADLHALVDGELDAERRRKVEDHLLQHPEDAALVETWRRQNAALRAAFEPVAHETPPLSLRSATGRAGGSGHGPIETGATHWGRPTGAPRSTRRLDEMRKGQRKQALLSMGLALFAGAVVAVGAILAVTGPASPPASISAALSQGFVARAESAYLTFADDARPVEIDAEHRGELLAWLRRRTGFGLAPDLAPLGLRLLGGRVLPAGAQPAGMLLYESAEAQRVALYFERAAGMAPAAAPAPAPGLAAIEWRAAGMAFVLIGPMKPEALQAAAERAAIEATQAPPENGG